MRICGNPGCEHAGKPQPHDAFARRRDDTSKWFGYCKTCVRAGRHRRERRGQPHPDRVECLECGRWFSLLGPHLRTHGLTSHEYRSRHSGAPTYSDTFAAIKRDGWLDKHGYFTPDGRLVASRWESRDAIVHALRRDTKRRGRPPKQTEWAKTGRDRPSARLVALRFGTWNAALAAAGLPTRAPAPRKQIFWTHDRITAALVREYRRTGRVPRARDWLRGSSTHPATPTVQARFGSWNAAIEAAGLVARRRGGGHPTCDCGHCRKCRSRAYDRHYRLYGRTRKDWTAEVTLRALQEEAMRLGRVPMLTEWKSATDHRPGVKTVQRLFGS
jgi:hypothetical protein